MNIKQFSPFWKPVTLVNPASWFDGPPSKLSPEQQVLHDAVVLAVVHDDYYKNKGAVPCICDMQICEKDIFRADEFVEALATRLHPADSDAEIQTARDRMEGCWPQAERTDDRTSGPGQARDKPDAQSLRKWAGAERITLAIVFTDVVGSTALRNEIGDERMSEMLEAHFRHGRRLIGEHGGREVKTTGDGFLAVFRGTEKALDFAIALHSDPGAQAIQIRVGIHVGEVTVKDNDQDIDGTEVHFASRVVAAIREAEIWLSDPAKQNIETYRASRHRHLKWEPHDGLEMKGFSGSFTLWSLVAPAASSLPVADQFPGSETFDGQAQTPSTRAQPSKTGGDKPRSGIPSQPIPQEPTVVDAQSMGWDVFISHASEDKEAFVRPLALALQKKDIRVWFDEFTLTVGDSLRRSIDRGLACSRYGIVVISPDFLKKDWPQKELDGLFAREADGRKVILPVWHNVDAQIVRQYSPLLADRVATSAAKGVDAVVADLMSAMASA